MNHTFLLSQNFLFSYIELMHCLSLVCSGFTVKMFNETYTRPFGCYIISAYIQFTFHLLTALQLTQPFINQIAEKDASGFYKILCNLISKVILLVSALVLSHFKRKC